VGVDVQPVQSFSEEQVPSLGVIESVMEREDASYRDRASGLDTKASVILSAAGVVVALLGATASIAAMISQALAIAAGSIAAWVIAPRIDKTIAPRDVCDRFLAAPALRTRLVVLNSRILLHAEDEARLVTKARRLRSASVLLLGSAVIILIGGVLRVAG
jgi:hypothetical protein